MRNYKVKTKVIKDFNDKLDNKTYEKNEPIILDRGRYEELLSKGFVAKGEKLEKVNKKIEEEKTEDETDNRL